MHPALVLPIVSLAGLLDVRWHRIPNWLVAAMIAISLIWHTATSGVVGLWICLASLLLSTAVLFPLFVLRGMGAGDVKFFGALTAALTYKHLFTLLLLSAIVAAVMGMFRIFWSRAFMATMANIADFASRFVRGRFVPHPWINIDDERARRLPFTLAVAVATWIFVLSGAQ